MKRKFEHPADENPSSTARAWRSQGQLKDTPEFREWLEREFPAGAAEMDSKEDAELSRRGFLKFMGASTALAGFGMASCRKPEAFLVPYTDSVEWVVPGRPLLYSTARPVGNGAVPMVITTYEGRPTKVEGNPLHPNSVGGTNSFDQASILDMYDPDRSSKVLVNGKPADKEAAEQAMATLTAALEANGGQGVALLVGQSSSPTRARAIKALQSKFGGLQVFEYEPLARTNRQAADELRGPGVRQVVNLRNAKRVLSLDSDFLGVDSPDNRTESDFAAARKPEVGDGRDAKTVEDTLRLYLAEPAYTVTGGMADHRVRVAAGRIPAFAAAIAKELGLNIGVEVPAGEFDPRWIKEAAADLKKNGAKSVVLVGERQPKVVHVLADAINRFLGSVGSDENAVVQLVQTPATEYGSLADLKAAVDAGEVTTLLATTPADPAYDTAGDFDWAGLREKLALFVHNGTRVNATAVSADYHIPGTHYLENWGDVYDNRGVYSVVQPMILPLYDDAVSELNLLLELAGEFSAENPDADPALDAVRKTLVEMGVPAAELDNVWAKTLRDGFLKGSKFPPASGTAMGNVKDDELKAAMQPVATPESLELAFAADYSVWDGRFINNGWLQEAPDPVTKLTWDNAALIAPKTAQALGIADDYDDSKQQVPMVEITTPNGAKIKTPLLIASGHAENVITLKLGYGQCPEPANGESPALPMRVGEGTGFNVNPLRSGESFILGGAKLTKLDDTYTVALTQEHSTMSGRALAREGTLDDQKEFAKHPTNEVGFAYNQGMDSHIPENISLYKPNDASGKPLLNDDLHQWGMVIDLNSCTGCTACLVACQAENNIPIVGKDQVRRGREMHWIRMDRYFVDRATSHGEMADEDNPAMLVQPVACVHCESAPCETVCPVNATVHSEEGMNLMAYNRCIGTRYCANNCPYKARRFNYFDYNKRPLDQLYKGPLSDPERTGKPESEKLGKNPNVSVRMRGVIEKCTYCIQRTQLAKIEKSAVRRDQVIATGKPSDTLSVSVDDLRVDSNKLKTACQQACPSEAIVFGNLLDPKSRLHQFKQIEGDKPGGEIILKHPRSYDLLRYIGTRPRTNYLARVRNPNKLMPDAKFIGNATVSIH